MRAAASCFAHPQPPVQSGVHQDLLLVLEIIAWAGAIRLNHLACQEELLRDVVEAAQSGGLPSLGYGVAHAGKVVWAVALPCGMAALLTLFPVVPWRNMVSLQEAALGL